MDGVLLRAFLADIIDRIEGTRQNKVEQLLTALSVLNYEIVDKRKVNKECKK